MGFGLRIGVFFMSTHKREMDNLDKTLVRIGAIALERLQLALNAVKRRDYRLETTTMDKDLEIDHLVLDIEDGVLALLGDKDFVTDEMWFAVSALKIATSFKWVVKAARKIESLAGSGKSDVRRGSIHKFAESWAETEESLKMAVESLKNMDVAIAEDILFPYAMVEKNLALNTDMITPLLANPGTAGQVIDFISVSSLLETVRKSACQVAKETLFISGEMSQAERWMRPEMAI